MFLRRNKREVLYDPYIINEVKKVVITSIKRYSFIVLKVIPKYPRDYIIGRLE